jgi:DUF4097 and DUF4098 domain-containing protein YvlB
MTRAAMIAAAAVLLAGCGMVRAESRAEDGPPGSRSFAAKGFDRVSLRGSDNVVVRVGSAESVTATGPEDVLEKLKIEVVNGELRIGREKSGWNMGWSSDRGSTTITVTVPSLRGASVAGSGDMQVDTVSAPSFDGSIAGSGNLAIASLTADAASLDIAGSGDVSVAGQTKSLDISIAGSGNLSAANLRAERAKIKIAGSGDVRAHVSGEADVSIVGSGDVTLAGNPRCRTSKMGSGDVRCG